MENKEDIIIDFPASFLKKDRVLYVAEDIGASRSGWMDRLRPEVEGLLREAGKKLILLPGLFKALNPEMLSYLFPGQGGFISEEAIYRQIVAPIGSQRCPGFVYKENGKVYFHAITAVDNQQVLEEIRDLFPVISIEPVIYVENDAEECFRDESPRFRVKARKEEERSCRKEARESCQPSFWDTLFSAASEAEREQVVLDPRAQAILEAWDKIEREFGITIEGLELLLGYKVKLSRLSITTSSKIFMTDFDNKEVKMDDLTKAVYFFYLRHPEGVALKELHDHEDEILHLYSGITGRDDVKKIRDSVRNLLDPFGNSLNVSMSRIKKAFKDVVGDRIARFYYVSGSYGEKRKIEIDRDLVIWEH